METKDVVESVGSIKGQISVLLKLMVILITGMGYAILQNHQADIELATMGLYIQHTEQIFLNAKSEHDTKLSSLEDSMDSLSAYCCGEIDAYK